MSARNIDSDPMMYSVHLKSSASRLLVNMHLIQMHQESKLINNLYTDPLVSIDQWIFLRVGFVSLLHLLTVTDARFML